MRSASSKDRELWKWAQRQAKTQAEAHPRDVITLECLANDARFAKPDIEKSFVMVEVPKDAPGVTVKRGVGISDHAALEAFFCPGDVYRFPFNVADAIVGESLSYLDFVHISGVSFDKLTFGRMARWSTASRSCFALVPLGKTSYSGGRGQDYLRELVEAEGADNQRVKMGGQDTLHVGEWSKLKEDVTTETSHGRFFDVVRNLSDAVTAGVSITGKRFRLYSVKTGVRYVGSVSEPTKGRLEANSAMAMLRSDLMNTLKNEDATFGIQTEVLTVTAKAIDTEESGEDQYDGFQVRELSCLAAGHTYLPGQAIPFVRGEYTDGTEDYWRRTFTYPLGRAKARLFLGYGLIHTSANAQNFVLGLSGKALRQFILRDVGDTSWHDAYIEKYAKETAILGSFRTEQTSEHRHVLDLTSSKDYPAPHIVRLAAWSVLTHDFAAKMEWDAEAKQYAFVTGLFDGFRDFIQEAFEVDALGALSSGKGPKPKPVSVDEDVSALGTVCVYPYPNSVEPESYTSAIDECLKERGTALLARAAAVRAAGLASVAGTGKKYELKALVATEETLLCCAVERLLMRDQPLVEIEPNYRKIRDRIRSGEWPAVVRA